VISAEAHVSTGSLSERPRALRTRIGLACSGLVLEPFRFRSHGGLDVTSSDDSRRNLFVVPGSRIWKACCFISIAGRRGGGAQHAQHHLPRPVHPHQSRRGCCMHFSHEFGSRYLAAAGYDLDNPIPSVPTTPGPMQVPPFSRRSPIYPRKFEATSPPDGQWRTAGPEVPVLNIEPRPGPGGVVGAIILRPFMPICSHHRV
jgi:hypothetical protein